MSATREERIASLAAATPEILEYHRENGELVGMPVSDEERLARIEAAVDAQIAAELPQIPESVTPLSFGLALIDSGISLASIEALLAQAGESAQWIWQRASSFRRDHPLVIQFGEALGKSDAEIDQIFVAASKI